VPTSADLEFRIAELGTFRFALALKALPPTSEPTLRFEAPLGAGVTETFTFRAYNRGAVTLDCRVGPAACFRVAEPTVALPPCPHWEGQEVKVAVRFEPEALRDAGDVLVVSDPTGASADFRVKLVGMCRRPQPQGPFDVADGASRDIAVRNVFGEDREYSFACDHPAFTVASARQTIRAKEGATATVKYTAGAGAGAGSGGGGDSGKLLVSCPAVPDMPPWVFYLRGRPGGS
jgi:hypothetical protein